MQMRNYVDQYHPQGGNSYQPPGMLNSYSANPQYGSYVPQVPPPAPHHPPMFENRVPPGIDGMIDVDGSNSTHRMTNSRLKTLIHNRQNQRDHGQLMPICNPVHEPAFNASHPVSPITQQPSYTSQYLPPTNHIDGIQNSMQFPPVTDNSSSLMHLQQLSPSSVERPRTVSATPQPVSWSESSSNVPVKSLETSTPHGQKSPIKLAQNGQAESSETPMSEETKVVNGTDQSAESSSNNCALESNSERVQTPNNSAKSESENEKPGVSENKIQVSCDNHVMMPPQTPPPRYTTPNQGFVTPPHAYRHLSPHHTMTSSMPLQPNCMPPPPPLPSPESSVMPHASTNGVIGVHTPSVPPLHPNPMPNDPNCDESNQSPFLWNTTTSMNTYINTTSTYNSKLSFSNATCLPTFALTTVHNSSPTFANAYFYSHNSQQLNKSSNSSSYMLPKGGGSAMSCIDSGRIQDSFNRSDIPPNFGLQQGLPLRTPTPEFNPLQQSFNSNLQVNNALQNNCYTPLQVKQENQELDTLEKIEKLRNNTKLEPPQCDCLKNKEGKTCMPKFIFSSLCFYQLHVIISL